MKITVIFTCYNRMLKTINCIKSLISGNPEHSLSFIVVDDNSSDNTIQEVEALKVDSKILHGDGNLYWAGGMRMGIDEFLRGGTRQIMSC